MSYLRTMATIATLLSLSFISAASLADVVTLNNGDRLTGTIKNKLGDSVVFKSAYLGEIKIPWSEISTVVSDKPVRIRLSGDRVVTGKIIPSDDGTIKLAADDLFESKPIPLADITAINPPIEDGKVKVRGNINLGAAAFDGNSDRKSFHTNAEVIARSKNNRVTIGGAFNWSQDSGTESVNNGNVYGKYDHFINEKWYAYANTAFETDRFQDLDLRSRFGGGMGYQFIETDRTQLSFEGGPTFVNEDFKTAQDRSFVAGRWATRLDHWLFRDVIQLFHYNEGLLSFDDIDDIYIRTRTGLRIPVYQGFAITTEFDFDYDNVPANGAEKTDTVYLLNLGYGF